MFSRSLDVKNEGPKVLYLSSLSPHSPQSCRFVSPSFNIWTVGIVRPVSPSATLSNHLLISRSSFVPLKSSSPIRVLDWRQHLQVFLLSRSSCLNLLLMAFLPTVKVIWTVWSEGAPLVPSLANLSASSFPGVPWCPRIQTKIILFDSSSFSIVYILPQQSV